MDFQAVVRQRLKELGSEQQDLAAAAQVTESYISQLLNGKKAPPAPERTDIYDRMEAHLRLPSGTLATLAELTRLDALKRKLSEPPAPLLREVRELILRKYARAGVEPIRAMFEKEPFGALERLVTQKLLDVVQRVTKEELHDEEWLRLVARLSHRTYEQMRVVALDFLETDIFNLSVEHCGTFLDPLIDSWEIDLATFAMEIILNGRLASAHLKRFEFVERDPIATVREEPGLRAFLDDPSLCGNATAEEIAFLRALRFTNSRPTSLYYYRELQSLRDPLHFHRGAIDDAAQPGRRTTGASDLRTTKGGTEG